MNVSSRQVKHFQELGESSQKTSIVSDCFRQKLNRSDDNGIITFKLLYF